MPNVARNLQNTEVRRLRGSQRPWQPARIPTVLVLALSLLSVPRAFGVGKELVGQQAPEISLAEAINAPKICTLAELRGKVVLLEFWATWCGPCVASIPHLEHLHREYGGRGLVVLGVSREQMERVEAFVEGRFRDKMTYPVMIDRDNETNKAYEVYSIPTAYLIDAFGKVVWQGHTMELKDEQVTEVLKTAAAVQQANLKSDDTDVRGVAAFLLGQYRADGAKELLMGMVKDQDASVQRRAATGLAALGEPTDALLRLLRQAAEDPETAVRVATLSALSRAGDKKAVSLAVEALGAADPVARRAAAAILGDLKNRKAAKPLAKAVDDVDPRTAKTAALALAEIDTKSSAALLRSRAADREHPARVWIAVALHRLGQDGTQERFQRLLHDQDVKIRRLAASVLTEMTDFNPTSLHTEVLRDEDAMVRRTAIRALTESDKPGAQEALQKFLTARISELLPEFSSTDNRERSRAARSVGELGPAAAPMLFKELEGVPVSGRTTLGSAIGRLGNPEVAVPAAERLANPKLHMSTRYAYEGVVRGGLEEAREIVSRLVKHESASVRESGIRLLPGYRDAEAVKALRAAMADPSLRVKAYAANSMARYGDKAAFAVLLSVANGTDPGARGLAISGLGYFKSKEATNAVAELAEKHRNMAYTAIYALQRQGTAAAAEVIGGYLKSDNANLAKRAQSALARMRVPEAKEILRAAGLIPVKKTPEDGE